tara:strand:+ start:85 stop:291 length:207 start_codon:yes stop_codon:yes gene_type:complete
MPMYEVRIRVTTVQVLNIEAENKAEAKVRARNETAYDTYEEGPTIEADLIDDWDYDTPEPDVVYWRSR